MSTYTTTYTVADEMRDAADARMAKAAPYSHGYYQGKIPVRLARHKSESAAVKAAKAEAKRRSAWWCGSDDSPQEVTP